MEVIKAIKRFLPFSLKKNIKRLIQICWYDSYGLFKFKEAYKNRAGNKNLYLVGAPDHDNLGDHAIAMATISFLKNSDSYDIHEIPLNIYRLHIKCLQKYLQKDDIILINGGGSMGVEWYFYENLIRLIIKRCRKNKIIIMPQTIYYGDSKIGKLEYEKSRRIYSKHPDLNIIAREKYSYNIMKEAYQHNNILLAPDMVLYLKEDSPEFQREGILLCFRKDAEKNLSDTQNQYIFNLCKKYSNSVLYTDTVLDKRILPEEREREIKKKLDEFRRARLVVTDRLHGMIFCAVTGTPCIALSNYNHKIKGVYEWIRHLKYIHYLEDYREISVCISQLLNEEKCIYEKGVLFQSFNEILDLI
jgi:pyruvyl transferase EpsI